MVYEPAPREALTASPFFNYTSVSMAAGVRINVSWETEAPTSMSYLPFNLVTITNASASAVKLYVNQSPTSVVLIPAGTVRTLSSSAIPALSSFGLENAGTVTIDADEVVITCSRQAATQDFLVQQRVEDRYRGRV
jgi:hypothetical protein